MIFTKIIGFFKQNKKIMYYLGFFVMVYFLLGDGVFANENDAAKQTADVSKVIMVFEGVLKGIGAILAVLTYLVTLFLDPAWVNGSLFGLTAKFKTIWIMVSNVVYFIFAILLIWIAFMNIIGKEGDKYQLKQALPKFVVGILIVPFSWFIVQIILSISSVLTVSAITLPYDTFSDFKSSVDQIEIKNKCQINIGSLLGTDKPTSSTDGTEQNTLPSMSCAESTIQLGELLKGGTDANTSIFGVVSTYTFGILSIEHLTTFDKDTFFAGVETVFDVLIKIVIDALFVLIYAILLITLGIVLMIRGVYLWLYIVFSPLFGLMYFFDKNESADGFFAKFNLKEFISLAMVPVYAMLALSFGMLFMYVVGQGMSSSDRAVQLINEKQGESEIIMGDGEKKFSLTINGTVGSSSKSVANGIHSLWSAGQNGKSGAMGVIGTLIIQFFGVVVLWGTIMAAMRSSTITKSITEPIHSFGTQVGSIMSKAPQNIPIFGGQSMKSMGTIAGKVSGAIDQKSLDRANEFAQKNMPFLDSNHMDRIAKLLNIENKLKGIQTPSVGAIPSDDIRKEWINLLKILGDTTTVYSTRQSHQIFRDIAKKAGMGDKEIEALSFKSPEKSAKAILEIENLFDTHNKGVLSGDKLSNSSKGMNDVDAVMSDLKGGAISSDGSNNNSRQIEALDTGKYRLDGNIIVELSSDEKKFTKGADGFANYVHHKIKAKTIKNINDIDTILTEMQVHDDSAKKSLKNSILKYFDKDGNFVGAGVKESNQIDNLDELIKKYNGSDSSN